MSKFSPVVVTSRSSGVLFASPGTGLPEGRKDSKEPINSHDAHDPSGLGSLLPHSSNRFTWVEEKVWAGGLLLFRTCRGQYTNLLSSYSRPRSMVILFGNPAVVLEKKK